MTPRQVVREVLDGKRPPYVPWSFSFTREAWSKLAAHFPGEDLEDRLGNHILLLRNTSRHFEALGNDRTRDAFGVTWDQSADKDIGVVAGCVLPEPSLADYVFPDPLDERFFRDVPAKIGRYPDRFRMFNIGFSLFERAWTLRGMENLLMDFHDAPEFVHDLLDRIADYQLAQIRGMMRFEIDAVSFGDDWGQQHGLIMGQAMWREFVQPRLRRMFGEVRAAGKYVFIHSCGKVDELFDDLISAGLQCFNPFQPEVMDVDRLLEEYRGRLCFFGGLSSQRTLPCGSVEEVRTETRRLIERGRAGGYILAPSHAVEGDVPLENMLAFIEEAQAQRA